jgi:hypothetical protein
MATEQAIGKDAFGMIIAASCRLISSASVVLID